jgi:8-oxo-dGTP pyrophosphatase MutT (NUDIX family)
MMLIGRLVFQFAIALQTSWLFFLWKFTDLFCNNIGFGDAQVDFAVSRLRGIDVSKGLGPLKNDRREKHRPKTLLQQLASNPDKLFSGAFRQQVAALCFRPGTETKEIEILVITSRDSGRWVIPKGWPMKGKSLSQAAAIEALQEAGVRGKVRRKPVGNYTYLKMLDDGQVVPCIVDVFQMEVSEIVQRFKEKGERQVAWVSRAEAARRLREIELKSLVIDFSPR